MLQLRCRCHSQWRSVVMPIIRFFFNPQTIPAAGPSDPGDPLAFHRLLPGYAPTPLRAAPGLAAALGIAQVWVKDESSRMELPAFKILGASWAVARALATRLGDTATAYTTFAELAAQAATLRPLTLAAATDGNHGRAVARVAALLGFAARIFVPAGTAAARIDAIAGEGASVVVVDGSYDDAVALAARAAGPRCLVISDTSWPGYEDVPRDVIAGYSTIFREIDAELARRGEAGPDIVFVQVGVGALAAAVVRHYHGADQGPTTTDERKPTPSAHSSTGTPFGPSPFGLRPRIVGVEPTRAACVLASIQAGRIISIPGPHDSIMAGLNCGTPSLVAWPELSSGVDLFVAIDDERSREAMRALARDGIVAGETGAAGAAGLIDLCQAPDAAAMRDALGIGGATRALVICTEGATDPAAYRAIVGNA
jgi:diaminopropionate ammonia-lyase